MSVLYTLIFLNLRRRHAQPPLELPHARTDDPSHPKSSLDFRTNTTATTHGDSATPPAPPRGTARHNGYHPAFLIYPVIYVVCTAPLALGRIATMAGATVPLGYFCAAGALITSNGWLDVVLWGLTRRVLLFGSDVDAEDVGLETFAFMRTPPGRKYGNMVWVQGRAAGQQKGKGGEGEEEGVKDGRGGWWWLGGWRRGRMAQLPGGGGAGHGHGRMASLGQARGHKRMGSRSVSQESLRGRGDMAIQMDVVTTVEVEVDADKAGTRHREYSMSVGSSEKEVRQQ